MSDDDEARADNHEAVAACFDEFIGHPKRVGVVRVASIAPGRADVEHSIEAIATRLIYDVRGERNREIAGDAGRVIAEDDAEQPIERVDKGLDVPLGILGLMKGGVFQRLAPPGSGGKDGDAVWFAVGDLIGLEDAIGYYEASLVKAGSCCEHN